MAKFNQVERGPQKGAPPSLEFVPIERLQVDPAYQRTTDGPLSQKIIVGMVKQWDWTLCQPLVVARRADGSMWILDGQHRHAGAIRRGDLPHLPCVVLAALGEESEARAFVELNTKRQRLNQTDIFHGLLAAGDENAKATAKVLEETGWRQVRSNALDKQKPGDLTCAPALASLVRIHGERAVREALLTLRQAYPDDVFAPSRLLGALVEIFRNGSTFKDSRKLLVARMKPFAAASWLPKADKYRSAFPSASIREALVAVILDAAGLEKITRPVIGGSPALPMATAMPVQFRKVEGALPGEEPKAWCEQCEKRRTRAYASACPQRFCKLRTAG